MDPRATQSGACRAPRPDPGSRYPVEATLDLVPRARFHIIDVQALAAKACGAVFDGFARCVYWSHHTTAGYLPQSLTVRLGNGSGGITAYVDFFRAAFPEGAGYVHDDLARRAELTPDQRQIESRNADAHLAFIGGGLRAYVAYRTVPSAPVYFIDLDGVHAGTSRVRQTTLVGYNDELDVAQASIDVPVGARPIQAINLKDPRLGISERIAKVIRQHGVTAGRVRLALAPSEHGAILTVNEYETCLMHHDLAEVLRNPLRFALAAIGSTSSLPPSHVERILRLAARSSRLLRTSRRTDLLVSDSRSPGIGQLVEGKYQSPILIQWRGTSRGSRLLHLRLTRFI